MIQDCDVDPHHCLVLWYRSSKSADGMLKRLKDKVTDIRSQAVRDEEFPIIIRAYDPINVVRRTIVRCDQPDRCSERYNG